MLMPLVGCSRGTTKRFCIGKFIMGAEDISASLGQEELAPNFGYTSIQGMKVLILEKDEVRCSMINNSESPFYEEDMIEKLKSVEVNLLTATSDPSEISECNVYISAIGTGVLDDGP